MEENKKLPEDKILIVGTKNPDILKDLGEFAESHTACLVVLDDKVIDDYLKRAERAGKEPKQQLQDFLEDTENRNNAEEKALTLWNLLTKNADLSLSNNRIFTKSEIVNKTTLSHKELESVLGLFSLFGLIEYTKGKYEFKFIFGKETQAASILADLSESINTFIVHKERYIAALKNAGKTEEEVKEEMKKIDEDVIRMIKIN